MNGRLCRRRQGRRPFWMMDGAVDVADRLISNVRPIHSTKYQRNQSQNILLWTNYFFVGIDQLHDYFHILINSSFITIISPIGKSVKLKSQAGFSYKSYELIELMVSQLMKCFKIPDKISQLQILKHLKHSSLLLQ